MENERIRLLAGRCRTELQAAWTQAKRMKKPFAVLCFIYLLGISAILRANFNYIDDMGRVCQGYKGWLNFNRHLSEFLSGFLHADSYLTDISPLPQLVAVLLLAIAGMTVLYVITGATDAWSVAAVVPLGLSPYFLECISYKYDSPYMALSILAAVLPLLLCRKGSLAYILASLVGMLVVCTTYQAASGIFPMLVVLVALRRWNRGEQQIFSFLLDSVIGWASGLLIFQLFLRDSYHTYVDTSLPPLNRLFPVICENYRQYFSYLRSDLKSGWLLLIVLLCAAFVCVSVLTSRRNRLAALALSAVALLGMLLLSFGVYPIFEKPLFAPRAMYGFGVFVAFVAVTAVTWESKLAVFPRVVSLVLSWCFFVFAFTYGNALYVQKTYTDFRIQMVVNDLKSQPIMLSDGEKAAQIIGTIGQAQVLENMPQDYQILNRLVPVTFCQDWWWGYYGIEHYYGLENLRWNDLSEDWSAYQLPLLSDTIYHSIYGDEGHVMIVLK